MVMVAMMVVMVVVVVVLDNAQQQQQCLNVKDYVLCCSQTIIWLRTGGFCDVRPQKLATLRYLQRVRTKGATASRSYSTKGHLATDWRWFLQRL
jgi:hypothetical protein